MAIVQVPASSLADVPPGPYVCQQVHAEGQDAVRLKRLGVCQGRMIELVGRGDPMIVKIGASRVGLSRQLAKLVVVDSVSDSKSSPPSPSLPETLPASAF
ncbi:FeoA family protein [Rhodopirellula sp. JC639]|uniref:FeoA family protein n=1 Tax=Stieleria mannarensis TaxID=2755585 RepID=UPI00160087C9|nr:FeoA family protein [Rhodopirellula sp. JC639]